jgi:hypothetical protein
MKLNCKVGDLAITVKCHVPDNLGKIVQIIAYEGLREWPNYPDPIPVWLIRAYSGKDGLSYQFPDGTVRKTTGGLAPDCFLKPISGLDLEDDETILDTTPKEEETAC